MVLLLMDLLVQHKSYLFSDSGWDGVGEWFDPGVQLHQVLDVRRLVAHLRFISVVSCFLNVHIQYSNF